jgi:hypothetical protein
MIFGTPNFSIKSLKSFAINHFAGGSIMRFLTGEESTIEVVVMP